MNIFNFLNCFAILSCMLKVNFLTFSLPAGACSSSGTRRPPFQASTLLRESWIDKLLQTCRFLIAFGFPCISPSLVLVLCCAGAESHSVLTCSLLTVWKGFYFPWLIRFSTKTLARRQFLSLHLFPVLVGLWSACFPCWSVLGFDQFLTDPPG